MHARRYFLQIVIPLCLIIGNAAQAFSKTLIISDSHGTGAFGGELTRLIERQNESVSFYAFGGTKAIDWIEGNNLTWGFWEHHTGRVDRRSTHTNTPKLAELIKVHKPNTIIIVLGTNMVWHEQTTQDADSIQGLLTLAKGSGAKCVWVGPPDLNVQNQDQEKWVTQLHQELEQIVPANGVQLISSWTFTNYPANMGDGVHYDKIPGVGEKLAREWAQGVFARKDSR